MGRLCCPCAGRWCDGVGAQTCPASRTTLPGLTVQGHREAAGNAVCHHRAH
jgi:hypothetical protein